MIRLVTANIASGRDSDGVVRLSRLGTAIAGLDADVVAMQEVDRLLPRSDRSDQAQEIAASCAGDGPPWHAVFAAALHGTPGPGGDSSAADSSAAPTKKGPPLQETPLMQVVRDQKLSFTRTP